MHKLWMLTTHKLSEHLNRFTHNEENTSILLLIILLSPFLLVNSVNFFYMISHRNKDGKFFFLILFLKYNSCFHTSAHKNIQVKSSSLTVNEIEYHSNGRNREKERKKELKKDRVIQLNVMHECQHDTISRFN